MTVPISFSAPKILGPIVAHRFFATVFHHPVISSVLSLTKRVTLHETYSAGPPSGLLHPMASDTSLYRFHTSAAIVAAESHDAA
jgi:hypothetical protein